MWKNILRKKSKEEISNFEHHANKRMKVDGVQSPDEYRRLLYDVMNTNTSIVYRTTSDDGRERILIHNEQSNWIVMIDAHGLVHSGYPIKKESPTWERKKRIGLLKDFIGDF